MRKVELLPTRDCEAGYGPASWDLYSGVSITQKCYVKQRYISEKYWYSKNTRLAIAP